MKKLDENVTINHVELNNWEYDDNGDMYPITYYVAISFYGSDYIMYFTTNDIQRAEEWGLSNSGCEGDTVLFDSADSYFENNDKIADILMKMMKEEWDNNWRDDSPYNYKGIIENT